MANQIADNVLRGRNVKIGDHVTIRPGCILEDNIVIEDHVYLDYGTIVHDNVTIGEGSCIGARCILGEYTADFYEDRTQKPHPLTIRQGSIIRSETIIYGGSSLGAFLQTGHRVTIREQSRIGHHVRIGTLSDIQGHCEIQDYVNLHSNVHVGQHSLIKRYAWLFPYVVLTNDPNPPSNSLMGVTVEEYAVIATGTVVLPGKTIGRGALVGAGSVVTRNIQQDTVAVGSPAREKGKTENVRDAITGEKVYPWPYTFDRGMPWQGIGYETWKKEQMNG